MATSKKTLGISSFKKLGESIIWESPDGKVSEATPLERKNGVKGISIRMGKKTSWSKGRTVYGRTIWIDDDLDLPSWLSWFIKNIKKMYFDLFNRKLKTEDEEVIYYQSKIEKLNHELTLTQQKLDEAERKTEEYQRLLDLAKKVKENSTNMNTKYAEFNKVIEESATAGIGKEEEIKRKLTENPWLLGLECSVEAKNQDVDNQTEIDLHVKTKYNQDRIFEFKSPNIKPFERFSGEKSRLTISKELTNGLSELITYLRKTDIYSQTKMEGTYGIQKATGYIIIGYNLLDAELDLLKNLNFHLYPHIQIITYNDLQKNIDRELAIIKSTEDSTNKA